jgi:hypothetical protein
LISIALNFISISGSPLTPVGCSNQGGPMRLILAAISFLIGLFLIATAITALLPQNAPEWLTGVAILISAGLSLYLTNKLVNVRGTRFWSLCRAQESAEHEEDVLSSMEFHATRVFQVEELHDEGSNYFLELRDGSVLFLSGHYFHEHEPLEFDDRIVHQREFPCTEFVVRRRDDGSVVGIQCRGRVLEPEVMTPPFPEEDFKNNALPKDGDIIASFTYDEVKAARLKQQRLS